MSLPVENTPAAEPAAHQRELVRPSWTRRLKWRAETAAYVCVEAGLAKLPLAWVAAIGRGLGALAYHAVSGRRRIVRRNLRIAFGGERSAAELSAMTAEVFRRSGANLLCSLGTTGKEMTSAEAALTVRDEAIFLEALARGKGVVVVIAHMGNWEAMAQWLPRVLPPGVKAANIYRPLNNPIMDARLLAIRARRGLRLFSKDESPLAMAAFLRGGGVLSIMSDQRVGRAGELVPFFGRNTSVTPLPAILARRTGAALIGVSLRTRGTGKWELGFHATDEAPPVTAGVAALLERVIRASPEDVFWMQDRWRVDRSTPHLVAGKQARHGADADSAKPTKRRRALLWVTAPGVVPPAPVAVPDDVDYELALAHGASAAAAEIGGRRVHRYEGGGLMRFLEQVDDAAEQPLDFVVGAVGDVDVARACRRLGLGWIETKGGGQ